MSDVSFVNSSTNTGSGVTSLSLSLPAGVQSGDLIIICSIAWTSSGSITLPAGFNYAAQNTGNQNPTSHLETTGYKIATGSEPSSYSVTYTNSSWVIGVVYVFRNVNQSVPIVNTTVRADASAYTATMPAANGTLDSTNSTTLYIFSGINSAATGALTITMPTGLSNIVTQNNSSLGGIIGMGWGNGLTSLGDATATDLVDYMDVMIEILPNPTPAIYRDKSAIASTGNTAAATLNVTVPGTVQINDFGLLCVAWLQPGTEETPVVPSWTPFYSNYQAQGTLRWLVFYHTYQSGDGSTVTIKFPSGVGKFINAQAYWWANTGTGDRDVFNPPFDVSAIGTRAGSGGTFTTTAPSTTTSFANETMIVVGFESTSTSETDITSISKGTERGFVPDNGSTICTIVVADYVQVLTAATPAVSIVYPNSQALNGAAIQIGISGLVIPSAASGWLKA